MRVISGLFKGRKLIAIKGLDIRPTPDKVKGAIFNIIGEDIIESSFLDLFAGTGAIGIEALSRGARDVVFADNNSRAIDIIRKNLLQIQIPQPTPVSATRFKIIRGDAIEVIKKFKTLQFDFIFLDPPYKSNLGERALVEISRYNILKESGKVIWEHYYKTEFNFPPLTFYKDSVKEPLELKRTIRYGDTALSFLGNK